MTLKLPDDIGAVRSRLASRQSFFGGPVSTREQCVAPSWKDLPSARTGRAGAAPRDAQQRAGSKPSAAPSRTALTKDEKRRRAYDYSDLYTAPKPLPLRPRNTNKTAAAASTAAETSAAAASILYRATGATPPTAGKPRRSPAAPGAVAGAAAATGSTPQPKNKKRRSPRKAERVVLQPRMTALGSQTVALLRMPRRSPKSKSASPAKVQVFKDVRTASPNPDAAVENPPAAPPAPQRPSASPRTLRRRTAPKQRLKGTFYGTAQPPAARRRIRTVDDDSASDLDSFIVSGGDGDGNGDDVASDGEYDPSAEREWRGALREALGGYDGARFAAVDALPDRRMAASYEDIAAEEVRAGRIAAAVDREEAVREAAERAARRERKRKRAEERRNRRLAERGQCGKEEGGGGGSGEDGGDSSSDDEGSSSEEEDENDAQQARRRRRLAGLLASM